VLVWLAVGTLGVAAHGLGANFTGLFPLCFAYLGLSQRISTTVKFVPLAVICYIGAYDGWAIALVPRLLIGVAVWMLLAVLIAELVARQLTLVGKLRHAAQTDALTGLGNRRNLDERVALTRPGDTIVICDLDHFKHLNDTQGHAAGDRVLAEFGAVLRACLRADDHAARYGGEEFALVLPATTAACAATMLRRLRRQWAILQPDVAFSAGIANCHPDRSASQTLSAADHALYAAKTAGRNQDCQENTEIPVTPPSQGHWPEPRPNLAGTRRTGPRDHQ
jgi:diguanylate cyclase (GGDEF)-like protein